MPAVVHPSFARSLACSLCPLFVCVCVRLTIVPLPFLVPTSYAISLHDPTHAGERFDSSPVVIRGCVDDLPCTPPAAQGGRRERTFVTNDAYGFDVENIVLVFLTYVLTLALVISLVYNIQSWRRSTGESTGAATHNEHAEDRRNPARPVEAATVQDALQEPLLAVPSTDETV